MKQYLITTTDCRTHSISANDIKEAKRDAYDYYKDTVVSVRVQKVKEYVMNVRAIGLEDGTSIPMKGQFDGTFGSGGQSRGIKFDFDTTSNALKVMGTKKKQTITIVCEITDVSSKKRKSWNVNVSEVE